MFKLFRKKPSAIVFTHIPKTAGTSLIELLKAAYPKEFWIPTYEEAAANIAPPDWATASSGHLAYGRNPLHSKQPVYVSIVRDPTERYLSYYKHLQKWPDHYAARSVPNSAGMPPLELAKRLVDVGNPEMRNLQAFMLTTIPDGVPSLDVAVVRKNYRLVGCVEEMGAFHRALQVILSRKLPPMPCLNVLDQKIETDKALRSYIERINDRDTALFEAIRSKSVWVN